MRRIWRIIKTVALAVLALLTLRSGGTRIGVADASEKMADASKRYGVRIIELSKN